MTVGLWKSLAGIMVALTAFLLSAGPGHAVLQTDGPRDDVPHPQADTEKPASKSASPKPHDKPRPSSRFDISKILAVIDRIHKEEAARKTASPDKIVTAALQQAIFHKLYKCWSAPEGEEDQDAIQVRIRVQLREDGKLMHPPQFLDPDDILGPGRDFYRSFAESARQAVQNCAPYDNLPPSRYELWQQIDFTFISSAQPGR